MTIAKTIIANLLDQAANYDLTGYYGIRIDDRDYAAGDTCHKSFEFDARTYEEAVANDEAIVELDGTYCWAIVNNGDAVKQIDVDGLLSYIEAAAKNLYNIYLIQSDDNTADYVPTDYLADANTVETMLVDATVVCKLS